MDNMMNLELLFHSADLTGNDGLRKIAISHADTTMKNHIRNDGGFVRSLYFFVLRSTPMRAVHSMSPLLLAPAIMPQHYRCMHLLCTGTKFRFDVSGSSWHVIEYNSTTGGVIKKRTAQGYSDSSTWARGQAWGIYGFANSKFDIVLLLMKVSRASF